MKELYFPMQTLRVTQGYGVAYNGVPANTYSHAGGYALDLGGADGGADWLYAPCDMVVRRVYGSYNAVWFESLEEMESIGSTVIMLCSHMNLADRIALGIRPGKVFKAGQRCYREGMAGKVTGTHVHLELGKGPFTGTGWKQNAQGVWVINNPLVPSEVFTLKDDVNVMNDGGYTWRKTMVGESASEGAGLPVFRPGDRVHIRPDRVAVSGARQYGPTYSGNRFRLWFDEYTVRSVQEDRAVLSVAGVTAAAVNTADLVHSG